MRRFACLALSMTMLFGLTANAQSLFAPDPEPTIMTGVEALVTAARAVFAPAKAN